MTELNTAITAVVVYPDRARVTRNGMVSLEPGCHRLEMPELPLKLDPASVRASARGTARARLLGVDVRRDFYVETPAERVRELEEQLETLEDEKLSLDAQAELLKREREIVGELGGQTEHYARGLALGKTSAEAQMALFDRLRSRAEGLNEAILDLTIRRRDLERRLQKLRNELKQLRGARGRERYTAVVEVEVTQAGDLTVALTYVVSSAGWQPLYDMRLLEEGERPVLEVSYLAQVSQRTGEDWPDIALTLSTARPALAGTLPELAPWYIGPVRAVRRGGAVRAARKMAAPAPSPAMEAMTTGAEPEAEILEEKEFEAEVMMATVETEGFAVTYQVPGAVTIPADGATHKVTVARFELSPALDYVAAPKLMEAAYRRGKAANDSPYTFLPGPANLFVGDEFIGTTKLELVAPRGEIEFYLGADDRVKVKRELKRREVDKRFLGDRRRLRYGYEITLENLLPVEAKITLHDQIPVPRHEDIKVKLESADPKPTERTELNLLNWKLTLGPGRKQVVRFDFTVEHPRGIRLLGLP
ncbi:MAG TPA: mucoidy inhibitor MuiA family protein [Anaerolineae bacterium]|nr:mucoidy inhibitor MuiA family protein [Anaerolineae bacterium]